MHVRIYQRISHKHKIQRSTIEGFKLSLKTDEPVRYRWDHRGRHPTKTKRQDVTIHGTRSERNQR